jgi:hypothetical protein
VKKQTPKNPHAVALGRLGGLVQSEAKKRANKQNGRKGGLVKSCRKTIAARRTLAGHDPDAARKDERVGGLDPRRLRTTRDRSRISRSPAVGALWLFWHPRQRQGTPQLPALCHRCHRHMAQMPLPAGLDILGGNAPGLCTISFASAGHPALCHHVAKP